MDDDWYAHKYFNTEYVSVLHLNVKIDLLPEIEKLEN